MYVIQHILVLVQEADLQIYWRKFLGKKGGELEGEALEGSFGWIEEYDEDLADQAHGVHEEV